MIGFVDYNLLFINGFELIYKNVFNHLKDEKLINAVGTEFLNSINNIDEILKIFYCYYDKLTKEQNSLFIMDKNNKITGTSSKLNSIIYSLENDLNCILPNCLLPKVICNDLFSMFENIVNEIQELKSSSTYITDKLNEKIDEIYEELSDTIKFYLDNEQIRIELPNCIYDYVQVNENQVIEEVGKKNNSKTLVIGYKIETVKDFCNVYLKYFIENNVKIIKCKNCGQYFIPKNRTDEVYCDNISPQNAKKTCKEYGAKKTYREQIKSNKVKYEHNKTSQFYRMRINRSGNKDKKSKYEKLFNIYKETYQKQKKKYNNGNGSLSEKDFIEWITKQKNI